MRMAMSSSSSSLPIPFAATRAHQHSCSTKLYVAQKQRHQDQLPEPTYQIEHNSPLKPKTIRFRLSELCRQGHLNLARQMFESIPQPTTVLWNTLIIGYVCNDMPHEAIHMYSRMYCIMNSQQDGRNFDAYTYSSVLKACAEAKELLIGKAVHCHLLRLNVYPSRIVYNSLLNMYAACCYCGDGVAFDLVERVFRIMHKRNVVSWNTMISWYAKTGAFVEAVQHFMRMMKMGFQPTVISFVNVFPAVSGLGDVDFGNALYGMVVKLGSEYADDLYIVSSAISMYAELGLVDFARNVFDNCLEKNAHVWNAMIGGYVQNSFPIIALELFNKALEAHEYGDVDDVTFLLALNAGSEIQCISIAQQLHSCLIKKSLVSAIILVNAVIALYSRCDAIGDSFKVFNGMQERDVVSWNTMISSLVQSNLNDEALMLVHEMQKQGFSPDDVTITALLSASSNLRDLEIGKQTHAYLIRHGIRFDGMESYLIDMYAKAGHTEAAETVFRSCKSDTFDHATWNAIISSSTQNGAIEKSLFFFQQMLDENVVPNAVTLASILPSCIQTGSIAFGKMLHGFAVRNLLDKNVFVTSALVDMYAKSGAIAYAERCFATSEEKNSVTYTNMILGYGQNGMGEKAVELFYSMKDLSIKPDSITFVAALSACSYAGLVDRGLEIYDKMESEYDIRPSTEHYASVVDMLARVGRLVEAYNFAEQLGNKGNVSGVWGSLLAACRVHRNFELGKVVADKLLEIEGADKIAGYRVLVSNMHAEEENWDDVKGVRSEMIERGLVKEVGKSWINVSGQTCYFVSRDKQHPRCPEIYRMLNRLTSNMKDKDCYTPPFVSCEV